MEPEELKEELNHIKSENIRLKKAVEELSILNDIATVISSTLNLDHVIELIVKKCIKHLKVEQGAALLLGKKEEDKDKLFQTLVRKVDSGVESLPFRLDSQLTGWMIKNQKPLLINDLSKDDRFQKVTTDTQIHSLMAVPLQQKGKMIGLLTVFNKRAEEEFTEDDKRLLTIIGSQSAQVIEAVRLYQEEQELIIIHQDMNIAREVQFNLLPKKILTIEGYETAAITIPAKEVGGDYYDFITCTNNRIAFCLGDVSGKGIPAAMLMANLQATLRGQTISSNSPRECIQRSNYLLYNSTESSKYATLFYGILNTQDHQFTFSNAGHNHPFFLSKDRTFTRLTAEGIPLGFLEAFEYDEQTISLKIGDTIVIFSDGITEAMNIKEEEFGEKRLSQVLQKNYELSPQELINVIIDAIHKHTKEASQTDDITLLVIKRIA
jgi:sigma-B regulation protein RsbU (phosphoserine phosphatase)